MLVPLRASEENRTAKALFHTNEINLSPIEPKHDFFKLTGYNQFVANFENQKTGRDLSWWLPDY